MATASVAAAGVEEGSTPGPQAGGAEIAFFDLETSVPQRAGQGYALLEFGAILVCPRRLVEVACYATLVRPADLGVVSAASVRCNGITRDAVAAAPCFRDVADKVYDLLHVLPVGLMERSRLAMIRLMQFFYLWLVNEVAVFAAYGLLSKTSVTFLRCKDVGRNKDLHMVFIDLEKAYDKIPRNVMWWALEKHKVPAKYITLIKDMYDNVVTSVRTSDVDTDDFPIKIGLHQGSALSPYLFALVMDEVTRDIQGDIPWCMLFADDVVLVDDSRTGVNRKLELWRQTLESKGFRLSRTKTEYMMCGFSTTRCEEEEVSLDGQVVPRKDTFWYLGSLLQEDGGIDEDVNHRIKAGWMKWRQASGILCDKRVPQKLKGKFYRTVVRPAMLYGAECWPTKRRHVQQLDVAEMCMLRCMCGHTRKDRVRNDDIRDRVGVAPIEEKLVQHRLRWFGHIQHRPPEAPVHSGRLKRAENVKRGRGRPNLTWEESVKRDLKDWSITKELAMDRGRVWAGHNIVRFDVPRIREAFTEIGRTPPEPKGMIDTLPLLTQRFGRRAGDMKMASLANYFGLGRQKHRSLDDVRMNLEVLKYCATVLFLEASFPEVLIVENLVGAITRSKTDGATSPEVKNIEANTSPDSSKRQRTVSQVNGLTTDQDNQESVDPAMNGESSDLISHMEEMKLDASVQMDASFSGHSGFLEPDDVSTECIKIFTTPSYQFNRRTLIKHKDSPLHLCCAGLKVQFGVGTKFLDTAGRPKLNMVVDIPENLSKVLEFCDNQAQRFLQESGTTSEWRPLIKKYGYVNRPTVRLNIPTTPSSGASPYLTDIYQKEPSGNIQKLAFSKVDAAELDILFVRGNRLDAFFSLEIYDYQQNAGIRLVAKRLVVHSK
ncbi:Retrovirus-related Pol polyprotein LINE-1 [Triticum urartu]|uniref:Retrovirus-related Pol polyprotein LINE-1 n=1 Tax=Triticum urartu TaxID=4572 RepID=M7ZMS7_TRIUA|nr:Retrovirus-related Pol polyprotein LINE-1 [Triticum urartu]